MPFQIRLRRLRRLICNETLRKYPNVPFRVLQANYSLQFTKQKQIRPVQYEIICRRQMKSDSNRIVVLKKVKSIVEKGRKRWFTAFSSFPTMFSKSLRVTLTILS